jgi:hypothetical protein
MFQVTEKRYNPVIFVEWKGITAYLLLNGRPFGLSYNVAQSTVTFYI